MIIFISWARKSLNDTTIITSSIFIQSDSNDMKYSDRFKWFYRQNLKINSNDEEHCSVVCDKKKQKKKENLKLKQNIKQRKIK